MSSLARGTRFARRFQTRQDESRFCRGVGSFRVASSPFRSRISGFNLKSNLRSLYLSNIDESFELLNDQRVVLEQNYLRVVSFNLGELIRKPREVCKRLLEVQRRAAIFLR